MCCHLLDYWPVAATVTQQRYRCFLLLSRRYTEMGCYLSQRGPYPLGLGESFMNGKIALQPSVYLCHNTAVQ